MTKVVHVSQEYDVYIGRPSKWGNPFRLYEDTTSARLQVIHQYKDWLLKQPNLLAELHTLEGKRLGCFCAPKVCHGDILKELIEQGESK